MQIKQGFLLLVHKSSEVNLIVLSHLESHFTFDNNENLRQHISQTCRCCFYKIRDLHRIRRYMYFDVAKTIATVLVSSRFDYFNSLYNNIVLKDILKLQRVQNCLAMVITRSPLFSHSVPLLKLLLWLAVRYRIIFKSCTITYQAFSSKQTSYFIHC